MGFSRCFFLELDPDADASEALEELRGEGRPSKDAEMSWLDSVGNGGRGSLSLHREVSCCCLEDLRGGSLSR